eukprot:3109739-Rhodomonas_salina.1
MRHSAIRESGRAGFGRARMRQLLKASDITSRPRLDSLRSALHHCAHLFQRADRSDPEPRFTHRTSEHMTNERARTRGQTDCRNKMQIRGTRSQTRQGKRRNVKEESVGASRDRCHAHSTGEQSCRAKISRQILHVRTCRTHAWK